MELGVLGGIRGVRGIRGIRGVRVLGVSWLEVSKKVWVVRSSDAKTCTEAYRMPGQVSTLRVRLTPLIPLIPPPMMYTHAMPLSRPLSICAEASVFFHP